MRYQDRRIEVSSRHVQSILDGTRTRLVSPIILPGYITERKHWVHSFYKGSRYRTSEQQDPGLIVHCPDGVDTIVDKIPHIHSVGETLYFRRGSKRKRETIYLSVHAIDAERFRGDWVWVTKFSTHKAPTEGEWWRLVEINTDIEGARYLTLQHSSYRTAGYREDWEEHFQKYWEADRDKMVINMIGDSYGPWHKGPLPEKF